MVETSKRGTCSTSSHLPSDQLPRNTNRTKVRSFICCYDDCRKSYTTYSHLKRHEDSHVKSYQCIEKNCGRNFKYKYSLTKHINNVHLKKNPKKYKCSVCDQESNKRNWLVTHQNRHTGLKPYVCSVEGCNKSFLVPSKLKRHSKIHEGYVCSKENCGKKFPTWSLCVSHNRTAHPKIYKCQICEKAFSTSFNLKAHSEVHNFDREVYLCPRPNCSRFYFLKRNLTHHLKSYHEKRTFICSVDHCHKQFKTEESLSAHTSQHNPKSNQRKKKKTSPKPSFASWLAGLVPQKTKQLKKSIEHENQDEALECLNMPKDKNNVPHLMRAEDKFEERLQDVTQAKKFTEQETVDVALEFSNVPEEKIMLPHFSEDEERIQDVLCLTSVEKHDVTCLTSADNTADYCVHDEIQRLLNMVNETDL